MEREKSNAIFDETKISNYPFLSDSATISFIKENARVMFIIRGLPFTRKDAVRRRLTDTYPDAITCSAIKYYDELQGDTLRASEKCIQDAKRACEEKKRTIIIKNSHVKRFEVQHYLNLAVNYNYLVIMIDPSLLLKFEPKDLVRDEPKCPNELYFEKRMKSWHEIWPDYTGWFISFNDTIHIHRHIMKFLEPLLNDYDFCRIFKVQNAEELKKCFQLRKVLSCIAAYFYSPDNMKKYYLTDEVQNSYGKVYDIDIVGCFVATSGIIGIVQVDEELKCLIADTDKKKAEKKNKTSKKGKASKNQLKNHKKVNVESNAECEKIRDDTIFEKNEKILKEQRTKETNEIADDHKNNADLGLQYNKLNAEKKLKIQSDIKKNILEHGNSLHIDEIDKRPLNTTVNLKDWSDVKDIDTTRSTFVHLGQKNFDLFEIPQAKSKFKSLLKQSRGIMQDNRFFGKGIKIHKLPETKRSETTFLVKFPQIICVQSLLTGFYP